MTEKISLLIKNRSGKFLLVKPKTEDSKKKSAVEALYTLPELAVAGEDTTEQTLLVLVNRICEGVDVADFRPVLEFESDDSETTFYFWQGDVEISKSFYEVFESNIFLSPEEFDDKVSSELDLIFSAVKDIDL